jgi:hypothetical protein
MRLKTTVVIEYDVEPADYSIEWSCKDVAPESVAAAEQVLINEDGGYLGEILYNEAVQTVTVVPA